MLGSEALIRLSLVISRPPGARGTLKSTRIKTRLFFRSRSRMESVLMGVVSLCRTLRYDSSLPSKLSMDFVDQLKSSIDIVRVIGEYVRLKRVGATGRYTGLCPFHQERTP